MARALTGLSVLLVVSVAAPGVAQHGAEGGEWRHFGADSGSTRYSPLDQIDRDNFDQLEVAWRWESADVLLKDLTDKTPGSYRSMPLMIDGVVYIATNLGQVAALDPATGEELWRHDPRDWEIDQRGSLVQIRGIESWTDGEAERVLIATRGGRLVSIDTKTGRPDPEFGEEGVVDLMQGLLPGRANRNMNWTAPVTVVADTIVIGGTIFDFPLRNNNPPGDVRGFDIRTGKLKWTFHAVPREGEPYIETWENESWRKMGNTNVWSMMSADQELGYVYLPFGTPTNDYYGGDRHGDNVYAESIVCLDARNGEVVWHFQTIHHGVWDYDLASAPNLIDITVDGKEIKAVAVVSKVGMTYVFDRATGEHVWPIVEAPVNYHSRIPGEKLSRTQPFTTRPPPFETLGIDYDDLIDFTPELRAEALKVVRDYVIGPVFTPPIVHGEDGKRAYVQNPGPGGGANWTGASFDPETNHPLRAFADAAGRHLALGARPGTVRLALLDQPPAHAEGPGPAPAQAALPADHGLRHEPRRDAVAGAARRGTPRPPRDQALEPRPARHAAPGRGRHRRRRPGDEDPRRLDRTDRG